MRREHAPGHRRGGRPPRRAYPARSSTRTPRPGHWSSHQPPAGTAARLPGPGTPPGPGRGGPGGSAHSTPSTNSSAHTARSPPSAAGSASCSGRIRDLEHDLPEDGVRGSSPRTTPSGPSSASSPRTTAAWRKGSPEPATTTGSSTSASPTSKPTFSTPAPRSQQEATPMNVTLDMADAIELEQLLDFLADWMKSDHDFTSPRPWPGSSEAQATALTRCARTSRGSGSSSVLHRRRGPAHPGRAVTRDAAEPAPGVPVTRLPAACPRAVALSLVSPETAPISGTGNASSRQHSDAIPPAALPEGKCSGLKAASGGTGRPSTRGLRHPTRRGPRPWRRLPGAMSGV